MLRFGRGAGPVATAAEEFIQHVILIGGKYQPPDRQSHHTRHMAGADITEIPRWHSKRYLFDI